MLATEFIEKYYDIFSKTQEGLYVHLKRLMEKYEDYDMIDICSGGLIFINKNSEWAPCLVAHMDTVHTQPSDYEMVPFGNNTKVWSPTGLGSDCRAGVSMILTLLEEGLRPNIMFTFDEEVGGLGASKITQMVSGDALKTVSYFIQIDRRGNDEVVFYCNDNIEFQDDIVKASGGYFKHSIGSFSDISTLMPAYHIPGANISSAYENEHTFYEKLDVVGWVKIKNALKKILTDVEFNDREYKFIQKTYSYSGYSTSSYNYGSIGKNFSVDFCSVCGAYALPSELGIDGVCKDCKEWSGPSYDEGVAMTCRKCGEALSSADIGYFDTCMKCYVENDVLF